MRKLVLMSWYDSNIVGDEWRWFITLSIRKNGTFSVGATQTCIDSPTFRLPSIYPLKHGRQVRDAINNIFSDDHLAFEEINWQNILEILQKELPELALEIEQAFIEDEKAEKEQEKLDKHIYAWINRSKWSRSNLSHHIGNVMDNARRQKEIFDYTLSYKQLHGKLPIGKHVLQDNFTIDFPEG